MSAVLWLLPFVALIGASPDPLIVDFGRSLPGHEYSYTAYFRNTAKVEISIGKDPAQCGSCPNVRLRYDQVAPGDSVPLNFRLFLDPETKVSTAVPVPVIVRGGPEAGMRTYTLKIVSGKPASVMLGDSVITVAKAADSLLAGGLELTNISGRGIRVAVAGAPPGLSMGQKTSVRIKAGASGTIRFQCLPEVLLEHRSLTFEVLSNGGKKIEQFSLPVEAK